MYSVFKAAGTPLPKDPSLVDYGFNLEDEDAFVQDANHDGVVYADSQPNYGEITYQNEHVREKGSEENGLEDQDEWDGAHEENKDNQMVTGNAMHDWVSWLQVANQQFKYSSLFMYN